MNRILLFCSILVLSVTTLTAQKEKVEVTYNEEDTYVILNEILVGICPGYLKIDFAMAGDLIFFKPGYYSYRIKLDPEEKFNKLSVELTKKPKDIVLKTKRLLNLDTLLISSIVTNMTKNDIKEILDEHFMKNNYYIGKSASLFPGAINEIENCRYKIAIEIVDSKQIRHVYKAPRFMMGFIKIRWSLLDVNTNKIAYFRTTEGTYFTKVSSTKGMIVSEIMRRVMEGAIKEAQFKLLSDSDFTVLINEK